ncbi:MAG: type II toxin-antitoxin system RelE/ParE family toxin [Dehalococcoidia bacterium]
MPTKPDYHPEAREEIRSSYERYLERNVAKADEFLERVLTLIDMAVNFPEIGSPYLYETRRLLLRSFPFIIVYGARGDGVRIFALAHTSRRPGYWRSRLHDTQSEEPEPADPTTS